MKKALQNRHLFIFSILFIVSSAFAQQTPEETLEIRFKEKYQLSTRVFFKEENQTVDYVFDYTLSSDALQDRVEIFILAKGGTKIPIKTYFGIEIHDFLFTRVVEDSPEKIAPRKLSGSKILKKNSLLGAELPFSCTSQYLNGGLVIPKIEELMADTRASHYLDVFDQAKVLDSIKKLKQSFEDHVVGQSIATDKLHQFLFRKLAGVGLNEVVLFYGPNGVGKAFIPRIAAEAVGYSFKVISMSKYLDGNLEGFKTEVFETLRKNHQTVFVLAHFENASLAIQESILEFIRPGMINVSFLDANGLPQTIFVNSQNPLFNLTTNVGEKLLKWYSTDHTVGFVIGEQKTASSKMIPPSESALVNDLIEEGFSEPVLNSINEMIPLMPPLRSEFEKSIRKSIERTVLSESQKLGVNFKLNNSEELVQMLTKAYLENKSNFRDVEKLMKHNLEPLIAQARLMPGFSKSKTVTISWDSSIDPKKLPVLPEDCRFILLGKKK